MGISWTSVRLGGPFVNDTSLSWGFFSKASFVAVERNPIWPLHILYETNDKSLNLFFLDEGKKGNPPSTAVADFVVIHQSWEVLY